MKKAFTMAEVLITIGIIGVVAAMTLPAVINKIHDKQNIAKWKKEFSVISNVYNQLKAEGETICKEYNSENGYCSGYPSEQFLSSLIEKLKPIAVCGTSTNVTGGKECNYYNSDYWNQYSTTKWSGVANIYTRYKALGGTKDLGSGYTQYGISGYNFTNLAMLMNDGAVIYVGGSHGGPWIVVDVNSFNEGPNEFGRDTFVIKIKDDLVLGRQWMKPMGAEGTYNKSQNGDICECTGAKGVKTATYLAGQSGNGEVVSGICCSAYYLLKG